MGLDDKLIRKTCCFLRMIIYLKKKCHFICMLQKSLYLSKCKIKNERYESNNYSK